MNGKRVNPWRSGCLILLALCLSGPALGGTLTPATGGEAIPSETVGGAFTELTGPVYDEANRGDVGTGSIVLQLPPGFEWDVDSTPVIRVTRLTTFPGGVNINNMPDGGTFAASSVTAQQVTFQITQSSTAQRRNRITFEGLRVRPQQVSPEASGHIVHMGTSNITNVSPGATSWGYLEQQPLQQNVILTANGELDDTVLVEVGEVVTLEASAFNCPADSPWRDTWTVDGDPTQEQFTQSACARTVIERQEVFDEPGTYVVSFQTEVCTNTFWIWCFNWEVHGSDSVTIEVLPPGVPAGQLLDFRMEEDSWDGSTGEVLDSSGNGFHATSQFGATTDDSTPDPAIPGDPGTCRYADLSGDARIQAPRPADINDSESFTVAAWLHMPAGEQTLAQPSILAIGDPAPDFAERFEFYRNNSNELEARFTYANGSINLLSVGGVFDGNWHHIAATRSMTQSGNQLIVEERLYLNGSLVASDSETYPPGQVGNAYLQDATGDIHLAGFQGATYPASARMDDVQIFLDALDGSEISALMARALPCVDDTVDHYLVSAPATAITCASTPVTIEARDADNNPVAPDAGTILTLSSDQGGGHWSILLAGGGVFNAGGDGLANYEFPGDESTLQVAYDYTAIPADPTVVTPAALDDEGIGSVASNSITVSRAGFRFLNRDSGVPVIPFQIAGKPSGIGYNAADLALQAIRESSEDPATCEGIYGDGQTADVGLGAECRDPAICGPESLAINGTLVATSDDNGDPGTATAYTDVALTFDANSTAPINLEYFDAGALRLYAAAEIRRADDTGSGDFITGTSNDFVWRPFGFHVDSPALSAGPVQPDGALFGYAGQEFEVTVQAVAWQAADDLNEDGTPDADADLSDNAVTPSFGAESQAVEVTLTPEVSAPASAVGGNNGVLSPAGLSGFSNGSDQITTSWNEVGYVDIVATLDGSYLGTETVTGRGRDAGRFRPEHFTVSANSPELATACNATFSYLRQPVAFSTAPQVTITPRNLAGQQTSNYADFTDNGGDNWWRLEEINPEYTETAAQAPDDSFIDDGAAGHSPGADQPASAEPQITITFSGPINHEFDPDVAPEVAPFDAEPELSFAVEDADGARYDDGSGSHIFRLAINFDDSAEIRHGRLHIGNAHGSELLDLAGVVRTEYFVDVDGGWQTNTDDTCTTGVQLSIDPATTCIIESGTQSGVSCGDGGEAGKNWQEPPVNGDFNAWFRESNAVGSHDVSASVLPDWLEYDWENDGNHDDPPTGVITFGIYSGQDRQIDLREAF